LEVTTMTKTWMVEQQWRVGDMTVPIRSVVKAETKQAARKGAAAACKAAYEHLAEEHEIRRPAEPAGDAIVLYAVG
jgi:hypothetical protein